MANHHNVWVLTRARNRAAIEAEMAKSPISNLHFAYYDLPRWLSWWRRGHRGVQVYYYLWQLGVYGLARQLHREVGFDLAHHVTFVKYWAPSLLALLGIPFIWGPVGGGESAPRTFRKGLGVRGRVYETVRDVAQWLGEHDPLVRLTARRSAYVVATTPETAARLSRLRVERIGVLGAGALNDSEIDRLAALPQSGNGDVTFMSMGRLLHWKGFHLGIQAFARADIPNARYIVVGTGPDQKRLKDLAEYLGIEDKVTLTGQLPREEALELLGESHVLVHPSLHDSSGWVCIEAMAAGHPVLCLDLGGPATQVTADTGVKVAANSSEEAVEELAFHMRHLAGDPSLREEMGRAARQRVREEYRWCAKVAKLADIYASLSVRPSFAEPAYSRSER